MVPATRCMADHGKSEQADQQEGTVGANIYWNTMACWVHYILAWLGYLPSRHLIMDNPSLMGNSNTFIRSSPKTRLLNSSNDRAILSRLGVGTNISPPFPPVPPIVEADILGFSSEAFSSAIGTIPWKRTLSVSKIPPLAKRGREPSSTLL